MSVSFWFKATADDFFVGKASTSGSDKGWGIYLSAGRIIWIIADDTPASNYAFLFSPNGETYTDGEWHHLLATKSGNGVADLELYVDNDGNSVESSAGTVNSFTNALAVSIGSESDGGNGLVGNLDEIAICCIFCCTSYCSIFTIPRSIKSISI